MRRNVTLAIHLDNGDYLVTFLGEKLRHVHVDERSLLGLIKKIEVAVERGVKKSRLHDGVFLERTSTFEERVDYVVARNGSPLETALRGCPETLTVLIPHKLALTVGAPSITITALPKPVDVTIAILNIKLDRLCGQ
ncbi:hypothetical protein MOV14_05525 [Infirmifilum sp. NZ]|nr:hypothetical protein MOV14_05525 [Infirmifilum sp. NZ]